LALARGNVDIMNDFQFFLEPPPVWDGFCAAQHALFHSPAWQKMIDSTLGSASIYGWDENNESGAAINIFKAGPFRIGYLGFPVGGVIGDCPLSKELADRWTRTALPTRLHCLRIPVSAFGQPLTLDLPCVGAPETAILNLPEWRLDDYPDTRRDINKASRAGFEITDDPDPVLGLAAFRLYRDTVVRNRGGLRYTADYFRALAQLSRTHPALRFLFALKERQVASFVVVAQHGDTVYYLHSGTDPAYRRFSPTDLLLQDAIHWAQARGASCFNLMSSPAKQTSLVRYKEKWGGLTREHLTYTLAIKAWPCRAFRAAERLYRLLR
jgi:GNAT superfamily N-acetyltransferase